MASIAESGLILMRYDTKVVFYKDEKGIYNPKTSKHEHKLISWNVWANVTDLGSAKQVELLGKISQGTKTVRLISKLDNPWDYLMIENDGNHYRFKSSIDVSKGFAMIVGQDNG